MSSMLEFLSSSSFLLPFWGFVKALVVGLFGLTIGVILTWVERRMRGMIQDSIGPNRASIPLSGKLAAGLTLGPALLLSGLVGWTAWQLQDAVESRGAWGFLFTHVAVFILWITTAVIARAVRSRGARNEVERIIGDLGAPRSISITGLLLHVLLFVISLASIDTSFEATLGQFWFGGGTALLVFALLASSGHVAKDLVQEKTVRLTVIGLLHPMADGLKTAFKADFIPQNGDRLLFNLAPLISAFSTIVVAAILPFGPALCFGQDATGAIDFGQFQGIEAAGNVCSASRFSLQVADLNVGLLYFFAIGGMGIVGAALAGWSSDNKFSLLGGLRAAGQMVSYEVTLGLTLVGAIMVYGSVRIGEMVLWQSQNAWGIFVQPFAFFFFIAAAIAESKRPPFDIPEGESELVAGYFTEYAGMKFAMFYFSEFIAVVGSSALMASLFFGGWHLPFFTANGVQVVWGEEVVFATLLSPTLLAVLGVLTFIGKTLALCLLQVTIRWTLPRFRYDHLMRLGWRKLLPASLVNVFVTAVVILAIQSASEPVQSGVTLAGQLSMGLVALLGLAAPIALILFLLAPVKKQRLTVTSAARYAEALGGIREGKREA